MKYTGRIIVISIGIIFVSLMMGLVFETLGYDMISKLFIIPLILGGFTLAIIIFIEMIEDLWEE